MKRFLRFTVTVAAAHVVTYIGVGVLAYFFLTKEFFDPSNTLVAQVMRTPGDPELWPHVTRWMVPLQIARGALMAVVFYPFLSTWRSWSYAKRVASIGGLYIVLGQWASTVAGSGTIEGWLILRPEFTALDIVVKAMIEGSVQGLTLAAWLGRAIMSAPFELNVEPGRTQQTPA